MVKQKKQEFRERLLTGEFPRPFNFIVYLFMIFLTSIALIGVSMLDELEPFESLIMILIVVCIGFYILKEVIMRTHFVYVLPGIILFIAIITNSSELIGSSVKVLMMVLIFYVLDYNGLITKLIRFSHEVIKKWK